MALTGSAAPPRLDRRRVVECLLRNRGDLLVVTGLGSPTYDAASAGDDPRNFYLWGAMGGAAMVGLGLALAQPARRVLVLTGDGEMLMGLGSLATIAVSDPRNLVVAVLDNEEFGETGRQQSHTAYGTDLAAVARGCGIGDSSLISDQAGVDQLAGRLADPRGPVFACIKVAAGNHPRVLPTTDGVALKRRFRAAVLGRE